MICIVPRVHRFEIVEAANAAAALEAFEGTSFDAARVENAPANRGAAL
jgi:hypothetical protein